MKMNSNNESISVQFPKCRNDGKYLKFCHAWGYIGDADWYYCPRCKGMFLIPYDDE